MSGERLGVVPEGERMSENEWKKQRDELEAYGNEKTRIPETRAELEAELEKYNASAESSREELQAMAKTWHREKAELEEAQMYFNITNAKMLKAIEESSWQQVRAWKMQEALNKSIN